MMAGVRRRAKSLVESDDRGITLTELIVAIALSTVVMGLIVSFFVQITNATITSNESRNSTAAAANIAAALADAIRPAAPVRLTTNTDLDPAIIRGDDVSVMLYSFADNLATDIRPVRIRFSLDAKKQLVEERWDATRSAITNPWVFPPLANTPALTRTLPGALIDPLASAPVGSTAGQSLFVYIKPDPSKPGSCVTVDPGPAGLSAADLKLIVGVEFTVRTRGDGPSRISPVTIQNKVLMPNVGIQCQDDS